MYTFVVFHESPVSVASACTWQRTQF